MCEPTTILAGVTAAVSVYSQFQASQAQTKFAKSNARNAVVAQTDAYDAQAAQANQERDAAGQAAYRNTIDAARARATANVAAGESGVYGVSADSLVNQITGQEAENYSDIAANQSYAADQRYREARGIATQTRSRINSAPTGSFNPVLGLLQIGAEVGGDYAGTKTFEDRRAAGHIL